MKTADEIKREVNICRAFLAALVEDLDAGKITAAELPKIGRMAEKMLQIMDAGFKGLD